MLTKFVGSGIDRSGSEGAEESLPYQADTLGSQYIFADWLRPVTSGVVRTGCEGMCAIEAGRRYIAGASVSLKSV